MSVVGTNAGEKSSVAQAQQDDQSQASPLTVPVARKFSKDRVVELSPGAIVIDSDGKTVRPQTSVGFYAAHREEETFGHEDFGHEKLLTTNLNRTGLLSRSTHGTDVYGLGSRGGMSATTASISRGSARPDTR